MSTAFLTIGQTAKRSGLSTATLRFYEEKGLISSTRNNANQRLYARPMLRVIAIIKIAQNLGLSLADIKLQLESNQGKALNWTDIASTWQKSLTERIETLENFKSALEGCIGCGCLSLQHCALYNKDDALANKGSGALLLQKHPTLKDQ